MSKAKTTPILLVGIFLFALGILLLYIEFNTVSYLLFSDAAKFADVARNLVTGFGYKGNFSFWFEGISNLSQIAAFTSPWMPPLMPFSIAVFFKIFGISDFSVIATSCFYFILLVVFTFLLGRKVFSFVNKKTANIIGLLSGLAVASNTNFLNYATQGATEPLFAFEIVAGAYFISLKKKWADYVALVLTILMYFTRPQAFIYIAGLLLYWFLLKHETGKAIKLFIVSLIVGFLIDYLVMPHFAGKYFLYSVTARGLGTATQVTAGGSASTSLRGAVVATTGIITVFKKVFYNLYNFYKLMPQIINPYLFALFIIGLFKWGKKRIENSFKATTLFIFLLTLLVTAASIPFFRYIHPVVPFVYIIAVGILVWLVNLIFRKEKVVIFVSSILVLIFAVGQTFGVIFLDSRFEKRTHNIEKPPAYVVLSNILKNNTSKDDVILTNLDTWGSWYGQRRTVWFPIEPKQLVNSDTDKIPFDGIYLTSYLIDDENYYMGEEWRQIFYNPENPENEFIADNFELKDIYQIPANETYEKQDARAILLVRKEY